jgi:Mrp family chromosome partitioning ATPase
MGSADGGRRVTALAAGGSVLLLSATAVALWPRTYGTAATFVLDGGAQIGNPVALASRIEAALLEREELASVAMELPPELRSPDPIGRLRAGIRVHSRGALGFSVEFRGSDPQSVQRIANRLADRATALVPKLASSPPDNAAATALAARTRAVTEFLTAHPEITIEQSSGKPDPAGDSGLDALRTEKHQLEQRLASPETGPSADNPYADPGLDPALLNRRLIELKTTIARREAALKQPRPAKPPAVAPELTSQWRALLAELASAQAAATSPSPQAAVTGHVTARAPLPSSPLTPNRLVLSIVAALLSMAAAMVAYVLPRKPEPTRRQSPRAAPSPQRSDPPPAVPVANTTASKRTDPGPSGSLRSDPPLPRSDPPPGGRSGSEPPGPIAVQRTVVLGPSGSGSSAPPAAAVTAKRSLTSPGGMHAPGDAATGFADTALAAPPVAQISPTGHSPPAAPLFGSRPPPGAGSYSVSSSHPPPMDGGSGARSSVERLSPLQSARPPAQPPAPATSRRSPLPVDTGDAPQIVSRPPALDPDAEIWAARFETVPPAEAPETTPRKRSGRWKTQVMGSMVPLEVAAAREERPPLSEPDSFQPRAEPVPEVMPRPTAPSVVHYDVPSGWRPMVDLDTPEIAALRDAVLKEASTRRLSVAVTGAPGNDRARVAAALALALAQSGARVLLVEADFDRPELHEALAITAPPGAGFSQQLRARRTDLQPQAWTVVRCSPQLQLLVEGRFRSPGLLASGEFERAIRELKDQHQVVVMHAPSLDKPGDLRALSGLAQAVVVTHRDQPATIQLGEDALRALL